MKKFKCLRHADSMLKGDMHACRNRGGETTMSEKVLGIMRVVRGNARETLFLTPHRVVVVRDRRGSALAVGVRYGIIVGAVIDTLVFFTLKVSVIEAFIIGFVIVVVCGAVGGAIGAIIARAQEKEERPLEQLSEAVISAHKRKKKEKEYVELPAEDILKADKNNFDIPYSEITKVELSKKLGSIRINMESAPARYIKDEEIEGATYWGKWHARGIPEKKKAEIEDYEDILRPVFGDKLSVEK